MTHPDTKPEALHIADACEDSATVWAHEIDTRRDAARELRRLHAECESLRTQLAEAQRLASGRLEQMTADLAQALRWRADARRLDWFVDAQEGTRAEVIEAALLKAHKLKAPREP